MRRTKLLTAAAAATAGVLAARRGRGRKLSAEHEAVDVGDLREDLRRELERLAEADVKASRSRGERTRPPG